MTLRELNQLQSIIKEIGEREERIREMEAQAEKTSPAPGATRASGTVSDPVGIGVAKLADERTLQEGALLRCQTMRAELTEYIEAIPDSMTRRIFYFRFLDGFPWPQVAECVGTSEYSAKQMCYRYVRKTCHTCHEKM